MRAWRVAVGGAGLLALAFGAWLMLDTGLSNIVDTAGWLVGGVIAHDAALAPATVVLVVLAARLLPVWARGPAAVGLLVLGSLTILAIPVLGRFGARADNPTLLDRDYTAGWLAVAGVVVAGVVVAALWRRRS
jgi:hypothetical protein